MLNDIDEGKEAAAKREATDRLWLELRIDLAAAHRLAVMHEFSEGIRNHMTAYSPTRPDRFLALPFGLHWTEAAASDFIEADFDGNVIAGDGDLERTAYCIHAPIHRARPDSACVFHTHMPYASALTRLKNQELLPIGQTEIFLKDDVAYDDHYGGFAYDPAEGERMAKLLGDKNIMFLANHGVIVLGKTIADAYERLFYLERAAQVQLYAMWTGRELNHVPAHTIEWTRQQYANLPKYSGTSGDELHFGALKRLLKGPPAKSFDQ